MHFKNILFSPLSRIGNRQVIRTTMELASRSGASLTLLGVIPKPSYMQSVLHGSKFHESIATHEREAMERELMQWSSGDDGPVAQTVIEEGRPASTIVGRVIAEQHDLLVVSTDFDETDSALLRQLLRTCPCPVWVARQRHLRPNRVLAAVDPAPDHSELNREILLHAAWTAELASGELHLAHAWQVEPSQMVMVGDYRFDLDCGRAAGTRTILVNLPENPWPELADWHAQDCVELRGLLG